VTPRVQRKFTDEEHAERRNEAKRKPLRLRIDSCSAERAEVMGILQVLPQVHPADNLAIYCEIRDVWLEWSVMIRRNRNVLPSMFPESSSKSLSSGSLCDELYLFTYG
jgi:hypothetical protein